MKNIIFSAGVAFTLIFVSACKSNDPVTESLVGSWDLTGYKIHPDSTLTEPNTSSPMNVIFNRKGRLESAGVTPFQGGWCNVAERYSVDNDIIYFQFGEANCIPFFDPKTPATAKILEYTGNTLTIEWGQRLMKLVRR